MWMTKTKVMGVILTLLFASFMVQAFELYKLQDLIREGTQSHAAVCSYKASLERQARDSARYLSLTPKQREQKYGRALGRIPEPVIRRSLRLQTVAINSLRPLRCP